jgi:peptidoglycan/xylan/chitin deacetylase (PgdA/CDA1 family)
MRTFLNRSYYDKITWPNDARVALFINSEFEPTFKVPPLPNGAPNLRELSERRYEATRGLWRVLDIFSDNDIKTTFFTNGRTAEEFPDCIKEIIKRGHELGAHSYFMEDLSNIKREEEEAALQKTMVTLEKISGVRPTGWLSHRGVFSPNTAEIVAKHGLLWHSDFFDDDLPYVLEFGNQKLVEIPRTIFTDDLGIIGRISSMPINPPKYIYEIWKEEFDARYEEGGKRPTMFTFCLHMYQTGKPSAAMALDRLLKYIKKHSDVWFCRGEDLANYWLEKGF